MGYNLDLALQPKQLALYQAIKSGDFDVIGVGGARGGAKSYALRNIGLAVGLEYNIHVGLFRRLSSELKENHIDKLQSEHPSLMASYYNSQDSCIYNPNRREKVRLLTFMYAETQADMDKFQGKEYPLLLIDEATQIIEAWYDDLMMTNRNTVNFNFRPCAVLGMNPGGIGHSWVRRKFIDKKFRSGEKPERHGFIQSHVWDNINWVLPNLIADGIPFEDYYESWTEQQRMEYTLAKSAYAAKLLALPEEKRKAMLFGDWNIFGGMFFKTFDVESQVIKPFKIPSDWEIICSIDPGTASPCAIGFFAISPAGEVYLLYTYYEKERNMKEHATELTYLLENISSPLRGMLGGRKPSYFIAGRDAFSKINQYTLAATDVTYEDIFRERGYILHRANTDRVLGWWAMKSLFPHKFFVFKYFNKPFLDEIEVAQSDKNYPEDIQGKGNDRNVSDHALDMVRYAVMAKLSITPYYDALKEDNNNRIYNIDSSFEDGREAAAQSYLLQSTGTYGYDYAGF